MRDSEEGSRGAGRRAWVRKWIERPGPWRLWGWMLRHIRNIVALGGVVLAAGLALALVSLWGLSVLSEEVLAGETLRFDEAVLRELSEWATARRDVRALEITALGGGTVVLTVAVITACLLAIVGRRWYALLICVAVSGGWIMSPVLKALFARPRPQVVEWRTPHAGQASFPSGHAMMAMVLYVTLAYVIHRLANRRWISISAMVVAGLLIAMIGVTRVYLGVHYPSDVLAGYAVGFSWAMFCTAGIEVLAGKRRE